MVLLDTNVLSALMLPEPPPGVARWLAGQAMATLCTSCICQAEILAALAMLPAGRRRSVLEAAARAMFEEDFAGRVFAFDGAATLAYAEMVAARRRAGRPAAALDLMIAATAAVQGAAVATRDAAGFAGLGIAVIDPWTAG
jgi:predicted nucleic acid-binding protein